jgi:hypothetical protein
VFERIQRLRSWFPHSLVSYKLVHRWQWFCRVSSPLYQYRYVTVNKTTDLYLLTPWSRIFLEKLTGFHLAKEFPTFYRTAFTIARHLSISWAKSIQSMPPPHPTSWRSILILSSHLRLGLPTGLFSSNFPTTDPAYTSSLLHSATRPAHLILLDSNTRTILGEEYRSLSSSLCSFQTIYHILLRWSRKLHISVVQNFSFLRTSESLLVYRIKVLPIDCCIYC